MPIYTKLKRTIHISSFTALFSLALSGCNGEAPPPLIFDWTTFSKSEPEAITPVPHAFNGGSDWQNDYHLQASNNDIIAVMMRNRTAPISGERSYALTDVMNFLTENDYYLNYVFSDFESDYEVEDTLEMVRQVRDSANPKINSAFIGGYRYYPAETDYSELWGAYDRAEAHQFYLDSGLNIAMPNLYPYSAYRNHHVRDDLHEEICVSIEHALFWAPLEKGSTAKRSLPEDHLLIPWFGGFVDNGINYPAPHPSKEDLRALVQHMRLRGIDGYYTWSHGGNENYVIPGDDQGSRHAYRDDMLINGWQVLDAFFEKQGARRILNLNTNKSSGINWSGMEIGSDVLLLISNFKETPEAIDLLALTSIDGLGEVIVPPGSHQIFEFTKTDNQM